MNSECRNDCMDNFLFPKKITNRPGLSAIKYRIGTYADFREALFGRLNRDPVLSQWTYRQADDPAIALLEGAAIIGDILTFYQELYAHEAYLRTARQRESIADLCRLLGYRLSPGLGGKATFAFEVKGDSPVIVPGGFSLKAQVDGIDDPAEFETAAELIAYPELSRFHLYRPSKEPEVSHCTRELRVIASGGKPSDLDIQKGDRLLLGDLQRARLINTELVIVEKVRELLGETLITFKGKIAHSHGSQLTAYKLNRSFHHFGFNAPREVIAIEGVAAIPHEISFTRSLMKDTKADTGANPRQVVFPALARRTIPLNSVVNDLMAGQLTVLEFHAEVNFYESFVEEFTARSRFEKLEDDYFFPVHIEKTASSAMTWGALTGGMSLVSLSEYEVEAFQEQLSELSDLPLDDILFDIRNIKIHEVVGEPFTIGAAREIQDREAKNILFHFGDYRSHQRLLDRRLQLASGDRVKDVLITAIEAEDRFAGGQGLREVSLDEEFLAQKSLFAMEDFPLEHPPVTVYGNIVEASQGKTAKETVLGNGDNRQSFQSFKLPKTPLTYLNKASETPSETPELTISVDGLLWKRVATFFGQGPRDQVYIVREDRDNVSWVQFGDGVTGCRLPSGLKNVVAVYRSGSGAFGRLKQDTSVQPMGKVNRVQKIHMPGVAGGGSKPESGDNAREAAPGKVQSLGRLVSLQDFERETLALAGVAKVRATWTLIDNCPAVVLTVLMETGRDDEIKEIRANLQRYNRCKGPQRFAVEVTPGSRRQVYLDATYGIQPSYRFEIVDKKIKEALGLSGDEGNGIDGSQGLFAPQLRSFGQNEYATRIAGTIQNVPGVAWVNIKGFGLLPETPEALTEPWPLNDCAECGKDQLLVLLRDSIQLLPMKIQSVEECANG